MYTDSNDYIYAVGGLYGIPGRNDVWRSTDQGKNWFQQGALPFPAPPGRSSGVLLISKSTLIGRDIMTFFAGYSRTANGVAQYHNDIWVSSTMGTKWSLITDKAPWAERDNLNAEVTADGIIVFTSGYNTRGPMNDVWISADGTQGMPMTHNKTSHRCCI